MNKGGWIGPDKKHDKSRAYPSQEQAALRAVLERTGLTIIGYEFKVLDSTGAGLWFDAAALIGRELVLFDLDDFRTPDRTEAKRAYCEQEGIPLLMIPIRAPLEMEATIERWMLTRPR